MKRRYIYIFILCSLLLTACSTDDGTTADTIPSGTEPVLFSANMRLGNKGVTRANNDIDEDGTKGTALKTAYDSRGFGVFGCYTGLHYYSDSNVKPDFMYNQQVTWSTDKWTYTPLKYWPNGEGETNSSIVTGSNPHYVSFLAYAPFSDDVSPDPENKPADYCIPSFSRQGEIGNPWLTYRLHSDIEKQVDLICAQPVLDQQKPNNGEPVHFVFRHALACVGDKINVACTTGLQNQIKGRVNGVSIKYAKLIVTDLKIEYTLTSKARLVLWYVENNTNDAPLNWQTILSEAPQTKRTITLLKADDSSDDKVVHSYEKTVTPAHEDAEDNPYEVDNLGVYYIPTELDGYPQTAKVSINYHIATSSNGTEWRNEENIGGTATLKLSDFPLAYQSGKHLYINISLGTMDISLTAAIAPWIEADPVEMEGIEE